MNEELNNHYEALMEKAEIAVQNIYSAPVEVVGFQKNVLLLKKLSAHIPDEQAYLTICVNFFDMLFYWGHYDMDVDTAGNDFKRRVAESNFSLEGSLPPINGA